MKDQQIIVLGGHDYVSDMENKVNGKIRKGWRIVSVTAQHVATAYSASTVPARGGFLIVMERTK